MHSLRLGLAMATAALSLAACGAVDSGKPAPTETHGPLYGMKRALRVGVKPDQPGIGLCNSAATRCSGLDVDIAREIATALRSKIVFQPVVSGNREQMILTGAVDLVIASYSITEERVRLIDFAGPYLIAGQDILTRAGDTGIGGLSDLRDKIICGSTGSISPRRIAINFGGEQGLDSAWGKKHVKLVDGYGECLPLLLDKTVDAVSSDNSVLAGYAADPRYKGKVRLVGKPFSVEKLGIGLAKGNPADLALINRTLTSMIKDGRWERIIRRNLGDAAAMFLAAGVRPTPPTATNP